MSGWRLVHSPPRPTVPGLNSGMFLSNMVFYSFPNSFANAERLQLRSIYRRRPVNVLCNWSNLLKDVNLFICFIYSSFYNTYTYYVWQYI